MNRPRKKDRDLPACVFLKCGTYYFVKNNKWHNLGKELKAALTDYARLQESPTDGMAGLVYRWLNESGVSDSSMPSYKSAAKTVADVFKNLEPWEVTARDVQAFMHHYRSQPVKANTCRAVIINALDWGFNEGIVERNVARDTRPYKTKSRDRYLTDSEFLAIQEKAKPVLKSIMDILYLTGQRISDVLAIRHSDLTDEGISFRQKKTGHKMIVSWSDELRVAVAEAKKTAKNIKGMTLFSNRKGGQWSYDSIGIMWRKAAKEASVKDSRIHDIRAKAATDAKKQGVDSKKLLGHASESSHQRYMRNHEISVAKPVSFRKN